jgi:hypothetical protein
VFSEPRLGFHGSVLDAPLKAAYRRPASPIRRHFRRPRPSDRSRGPQCSSHRAARHRPARGRVARHLVRLFVCGVCFGALFFFASRRRRSSAFPQPIAPGVQSCRAVVPWPPWCWKSRAYSAAGAGIRVRAFV